MTETWRLMLALPIGASLGAIFFGGLWWTVRRALTSNQPALWFLASLFVRTCVVMAGFYLVARGDWRQLPVCLVGFIAARLMVTHFTRVEASHAP